MDEKPVAATEEPKRMVRFLIDPEQSDEEIVAALLRIGPEKVEASDSHLDSSIALYCRYSSRASGQRSDAGVMMSRTNSLGIDSVVLHPWV